MDRWSAQEEANKDAPRLASLNRDAREAAEFEAEKQMGQYIDALKKYGDVMIKNGTRYGNDFDYREFVAEKEYEYKCAEIYRNETVVMYSDGPDEKEVDYSYIVNTQKETARVTRYLKVVKRGTGSHVGQIENELLNGGAYENYLNADRRRYRINKGISKAPFAAINIMYLIYAISMFVYSVFVSALFGSPEPMFWSGWLLSNIPNVWEFLSSCYIIGLVAFGLTVALFIAITVLYNKCVKWEDTYDQLRPGAFFIVTFSFCCFLFFMSIGNALYLKAGKSYITYFSVGPDAFRIFALFNNAENGFLDFLSVVLSFHTSFFSVFIIIVSIVYIIKKIIKVGNFEVYDQAVYKLRRASKTIESGEYDRVGKLLSELKTYTVALTLPRTVKPYDFDKWIEAQVRAAWRSSRGW